MNFKKILHVKLAGVFVIVFIINISNLYWDKNQYLKGKNLGTIL